MEKRMTQDDIDQVLMALQAAVVTEPDTVRRALIAKELRAWLQLERVATKTRLPAVATRQEGAPGF